MSLLILLIIILIPATEISVFLQTGKIIGLWPTLALIIITAIVGSLLLRYHGLSTMFKVRESMNAGKMPINELFDGFCLLAAGVFLITPGFITDGLGLILCLPFSRSMLRVFIGKRFKNRETFNHYAQTEFNRRNSFTQDPNIIDGECYEIINDSDGKNKTVDNKKPICPPTNLKRPLK